MKRELIPAILSKTAADAKQKFDACHGLVSWVQLDIMDGKFVKNKTWHSAAEIKKWNIDPAIELHLMVKRPLAIMKRFRSVKKFTRAIWHVETDIDHEELLDWCEEHKIKGGLALSPKTPLDAITPYLYHRAFSRALILGVTPGWSGQKLQAHTYKKARALRGLLPNIPISFDGGVKRRNIPTLAKYGVTGFCAASSIFSSDEPRAKIKEFKSLIRELP